MQGWQRQIYVKVKKIFTNWRWKIRFPLVNIIKFLKRTVDLTSPNSDNINEQSTTKTYFNSLMLDGSY